MFCSLFLYLGSGCELRVFGCHVSPYFLRSFDVLICICTLSLLEDEQDLSMGEFDSPSFVCLILVVFRMFLSVLG